LGKGTLGEMQSSGEFLVDASIARDYAAKVPKLVNLFDVDFVFSFSSWRGGGHVFGLLHGELKAKVVEDLLKIDKRLGVSNWIEMVNRHVVGEKELEHLDLLRVSEVLDQMVF